MLNSSLHAVLLLLVAIISVQSAGALAKILIHDFSALTVSAMRLFFGGSILAILFKIWTIRFSQVHWNTVLQYGLAIAGMNALFYLSIERLPLGIAVGFEFVGPLGVALYHARHRYDLIWVGLAIFGVILLFPFKEAHQGLDAYGVVFALAAGAFWAIYILVGHKPTGLSANHTVCLGMNIAMLCLLPFVLFSKQITAVFELPTFYYFLGLAILASALPFSLEMLALRNLTTLSFGTLMSLEPAIAALSGLIFLKEQLLWSQWLALLTIVIASIGCTLSSQNKDSPSLKTSAIE